MKKQHQAQVQALQALIEKTKQEAASAVAQAGATQPGADSDARVQELERELRELKEGQAADIAKALDDGRNENNLKWKIKESQLVKNIKRVKELEQKITEWEASGTLPAGSLASTGTAPTALPAQAKPAAGGAASAATAAKPVPAATQPRPAQAKAAAAGPSTGATATGGLPKRPGPTGAAAGAPATTTRGGAPAVRGRGAARGAARGLPNRALPTRQTTPLSGGVSIMGAAAAAAASAGGAAPKRPREDGDAGPGEDSLAKRLKPAEGEATGAPGKPVQIRRPAPTT